GHRGQDMRDTVAEMAAKAQEISQEAGSKMAGALRDVIHAASGIAGFAVESARDLVQYMVRRGQMTQEDADKLIREAEEANTKRPNKLPVPVKPTPVAPGTKAAAAAAPAPVAPAPVAPAPHVTHVPHITHAAPHKSAPAAKHAPAKAHAKPVAKAAAKSHAKPAAKKAAPAKSKKR